MSSRSAYHSKISSAFRLYMLTFIWNQAQASLDLHSLSAFILSLRLCIVAPTYYTMDIRDPDRGFTIWNEVDFINGHINKCELLSNYIYTFYLHRKSRKNNHKSKTKVLLKRQTWDALVLENRLAQEKCKGWKQWNWKMLYRWRENADAGNTFCSGNDRIN